MEFFSNAPLVWASVGVFLMLAELLIPGGIVVFLGISALLVAGALQLGLIDSQINAFSLFFISSLILLLMFRKLGQQMVGGDSHIDNTDEELDVFGQQVEVIETIGPGNKKGRIRFQGTEWTALGDGNVLEKGSTVQIVCRDNISYVVEKISPPTPD
ncbi:NfeD family protein [Thalassotalea aquiviva]|uniref:NfeD family protein n=1 Tax=Thalassotalea aquiviva TaxID=3242415 RepID=UPI00352AE082